MDVFLSAGCLIMSQVTVTTTTTTPLVTVICSGALFITTTDMLALTSGPSNAESACGAVPTVDSDGNNQGFFWPHHYATTTTTLVPDAFLGIFLLCHGLLQVSFLFQS